MQKKAAIFKSLFLLIILVAIGLVSYFRIFDVFELQTLDLRFKVRPAQAENEDVVLIEISDDSISKIGRWPFERQWHAELINVLAQYQVKSIVFDLIFSEESPQDQMLINATKSAGCVYYPYVFKLDKNKKALDFEVRPLYALDEASFGSGHINIISDADGKNRRVPLYFEYGGSYYPHVAFLAACDYLDVPQRKKILIKKNKFIELTPQIKIPIDDKYQMLVNYADRWSKAFKHYSYIDILKSYSLAGEGEKPIINLDNLKGKVCFVGLTALGLSDVDPIPLEPRYPNLGVHANIFNTIVENNFLKRESKFFNLIVLFFMLVIIRLVTLKTRTFLSLYLVLTILVGYAALTFVLFIFYGIWLDLFYPVLIAILLYLSLIFFKYILELYKRQLIEKELDVAREVQDSFLPHNLPQRKSLSIAAVMRPAKHVAGDLYQFINFSENRLGVIVGDVSGKGMPAALFMAKIISELKFQAKSDSEPSSTLSDLNTSLCLEAKTGLFVTLSYAIIDENAKKIILSDGGHLPVLLKKNDSKQVIPLEVSDGMPLGLMKGAKFSQQEFQLAGGDVLVFYSDGITEAKNAKKEEFGQKRLVEVLQRCAEEKSSSQILESIEKEVKRFVAGAYQHDDITIVVVKFN